MKHEMTTQTVVGRHAHVHVCPADGSMVVSLGRLALRLERHDVEDLVETLEIALLTSSPEAAAKVRAGAASASGSAAS